MYDAENLGVTYIRENVDDYIANEEAIERLYKAKEELEQLRAETKKKLEELFK